MKRYAVLGTGLMGAAVARTLLHQGHQVAVWNRTPSRAQPLVEFGAIVCANAAEAIAASDTVIVVLLDHDSALATLKGKLDQLRGKCLINLMTGTPPQAEEFSELCAQVGAAYLDGAVEAYPSDIGHADALINVSGSAKAWDEHKDTLKGLAGRTKYFGAKAGSANLLDAALAGTLHSVCLGAVCETLSFLSGAGIDVARPELDLDYWFDLVREEAQKIVADLTTGTFETSEATLSVHLAAVRQWRVTMLESGERATLMTAHLHNLELAAAAGLSEEGFLAQIKTARVAAPTSGTLPATDPGLVTA